MNEQKTEQLRSRRQKKMRKRKKIVRIKLAVLFTIAICGINFLIHALKPYISDLGDTAFANAGEEESYIDIRDASINTPVIMNDDEIKTKINKLASDNEEYKKISENYDAYPKELLASLCNNPEMLSFVQDYLDSAPVCTGGFTKEEKKADFPLLNQWDKRWGYAPYGDSCIALSGCAPTCISMVAFALTGNADATPAAVADYAMNRGYYKPGTGTAWSLMTEGSGQFGIQGREVSLDKGAVFKHLEAGEPVICSMRPGDFTTQGHFIVLAAVVDGKVVVRDPNCISRSRILWDWDRLQPQIKNLWAFSA